MNSLITYKPMGAFDLFRDFDRALSSFFTDTPVWKSRTPVVDVREEEGRYVLEAELPGMDEKSVEVRVEENLLTLSSTTREEKEEKRDGYLMRERRGSSFQRSFVLPRDVDRDKIHARFRNGLLVLELNKKPEAKPKAIEVKAE